MAYVSWVQLLEHRIPTGDFTAPWALVLDTIRQSTHLQIKASGLWTPQGGQLKQCGPDGLLESSDQTKKLFVADCPVGALIGKFGGSSAVLTPVPKDDKDAGTADPAPTEPKEGKAFALGAFCVVKVPAQSIGPLYVSFNGLVRPVRIDEEVVITVSGATASL